MEKNTIGFLDRKNLMDFFNSGGFVFDFTTSDFNKFTAESIGIALCEKYGLSKGKSLDAYVNEASSENVIKLLSDLMNYYEQSDFKDKPYNKTTVVKYPKAKLILDKLNGLHVAKVETEELKEKFNSGYINTQIDLMVKMQDENPTEAIGKAKEFIESCCKTILEKEGVKVDKNWDIIKLVDETFNFYNLMPRQVADDIKGSKSIKQILGNLKGIAQGVAELRNQYGSGHGKSSTYKGLESRHASLAVGSSITLVRFLWASYEHHCKIKENE